MTASAGDALPPQVAAALAQLDDFIQMFAQHPDEEVQEAVVGLLRAVDVLHRGALMRLSSFLAARSLTDELLADPGIALLFELYDSPQDRDERARAEAAVAFLRPQVESQGGQIEVVAAEAGVINIRLLARSGDGCSAAAGLHRLVEEALRAQLPEFVRMEVAPSGNRAVQQGNAQQVFIPVSSITRRGV